MLINKILDFLSQNFFEWIAHTLISSEQPERIAHGGSFDLSEMSKWAMSEWENSQPCPGPLDPSRLLMIHWPNNNLNFRKKPSLTWLAQTQRYTCLASGHILVYEIRHTVHRCFCSVRDRLCIFYAEILNIFSTHARYSVIVFLCNEYYLDFCELYVLYCISF